MVSPSRGLSLQWRRRTGRSLGPAGEHLDREVVGIGLYARVPAPFAERDAGAYQSLWLRAADADPTLLGLSGRPGRPPSPCRRARRPTSAPSRRP